MRVAIHSCAPSSSAWRTWLHSSKNRGSSSTSSGRGRGRSIVDVGDDPCRPRRDDEHSIAESHSLADRMGDEQRRDAAALDELVQQTAHLRAGDLVERGERFVHRQQRRAEGKGPHQRDTLLHAAGELVGMGIEERAETDPLQQLDRVGRGRAVGAAVDVEQQAGVGANGPPREQTGVLRHDGDLLVPPRLDRRLAIDQCVARGRRLEPGDDAQKRRLAAARRADDADERALLDVEVDRRRWSPRVPNDLRKPRSETALVMVDRDRAAVRPVWRGCRARC